MYFCPFCGTLLLLERGHRFQFFCPADEFVFPIQQVLSTVHDLRAHNKKSGAEAGDFADQGGGGGGGQKTRVRCESGEDCRCEEAFFVQVQLRSADEPPTTHYKCIECGFQWRTD